MMQDQIARNVLVTGGAGGIGTAISTRLAERGYAVSVLDLDGRAAEVLAGEISERGLAARGFELDITRYEDVVRVVAESEAHFGPVFGLVNNAGWDRAVPFVDTRPDFWQRVIDINLYGPLHVTHAVCQLLTKHGEGRVVTIASDAGRVGSSGESVYSAAKGGMIALMKSLAREFARQGITFNSVCPGPTDTKLLAQLEDSGRLAGALAKAIPMKRLAQPSDFPGIVAFLLSEEAAFITGQTISVSGGLTMHG
jgi:2-hydroxycyclohexanecarboxyl-CoA dehydrogenase